MQSTSDCVINRGPRGQNRAFPYQLKRPSCKCKQLKGVGSILKKLVPVVDAVWESRVHRLSYNLTFILRMELL